MVTASDLMKYAQKIYSDQDRNAIFVNAVDRNGVMKSDEANNTPIPGFMEGVMKKTSFSWIEQMIRHFSEGGCISHMFLQNWLSILSIHQLL
jgi:hypothetical protein